MSAGQYVTATEIYSRAHNAELSGNIRRKTHCALCGTDKYDYGFPVVGKGGLSDSFSRWSMLYSGADTICPHCSFVLSRRKELHSSRLNGVFGFMSEDCEDVFVIEAGDEGADNMLTVVRNLDRMRGYAFWSFQKKSKNMSHYLPFTTVCFIGEMTRKFVITEYPRVNFFIDIPFLKAYAEMDFTVPLWWDRIKPEDEMDKAEKEVLKKAEDLIGIKNIYRHIKEIEIINQLKRSLEKRR